MSEPIIIEGKENVRTATLITLAHALALELNTTMRAGRLSAYDAAKLQGVIPNDSSRGTKNNKVKALKKTLEMIKEQYPDYEPSKSIRIAVQR